MQQATHVAFSDDNFLVSLADALKEREARLNPHALTSQDRDLPLTWPEVAHAGTPRSRGRVRFWSRAPTDAPMRVLPHEQASFQAFVVKAKARMKDMGIASELTQEAAMKAWLVAAESERQRVVTSGGRVEDHPHLQRFWSALDSGAAGV